MVIYANDHNRVHGRIIYILIIQDIPIYTYNKYKKKSISSMVMSAIIMGSIARVTSNGKAILIARGV